MLPPSHSAQDVFCKGLKSKVLQMRVIRVDVVPVILGTRASEPPPADATPAHGSMAADAPTPSRSAPPDAQVPAAAPSPIDSPVATQVLQVHTQAPVHAPAPAAPASAPAPAPDAAATVQAATVAAADAADPSQVQAQALIVRNDELNASRHYDPNKTNVKRLGVLHELELRKSPSTGFGFSLTTRDVPIGGLSPIYVKHIVHGGPAQVEGQLRVGDRLLEVRFALFSFSVLEGTNTNSYSYLFGSWRH